jgi:hypothetical protein
MRAFLREHPAHPNDKAGSTQINGQTSDTSQDLIASHHHSIVVIFYEINL